MNIFKTKQNKNLLKLIFSATFSKAHKNFPTHKIVTVSSPETWGGFFDSLLVFAGFLGIFKLSWVLPFGSPVFNLQLGLGHIFMTSLLVEIRGNQKRVRGEKGRIIQDAKPESILFTPTACPAVKLKTRQWQKNL